MAEDTDHLDRNSPYMRTLAQRYPPLRDGLGAAFAGAVVGVVLVLIAGVSLAVAEETTFFGPSLGLIGMLAAGGGLFFMFRAVYFTGPIALYRTLRLLPLVRRVRQMDNDDLRDYLLDLTLSYDAGWEIRKHMEVSGRQWFAQRRQMERLAVESLFADREFNRRGEAGL